MQTGLWSLDKKTTKFLLQIGAAPEWRVVFSSGLFIINFYMIVSFIFTAFEPFYKEFEEENSNENFKQID